MRHVFNKDPEGVGGGGRERKSSVSVSLIWNKGKSG